MAAQPDAALVPEVLAYLEREQDADLIVSAIRMLQEADSPEAREGLMKLLQHGSWQVRARRRWRGLRRCSRTPMSGATWTPPNVRRWLKSIPRC